MSHADCEAAAPLPDEPPQKESGPTPEAADRWIDELGIDGSDLPPY